MPDALQPELPLPFPPRADMPALPARMVNEFVYCPRLAYLEWVQGEWTSGRRRRWRCALTSRPGHSKLSPATSPRREVFAAALRAVPWGVRLRGALAALLDSVNQELGISGRCRAGPVAPDSPRHGRERSQSRLHRPARAAKIPGAVFRGFAPRPH